MKKAPLILFLLMVCLSRPALAEYRAYWVEVYDHILKKKWEERTGFSPDQYILTHGGGNRLSVFVKATWMCYGDTSKFQPACPVPPAIEPRFQVGDRVKIKLEKHITEGWIGVIEIAYYQAGVKSNVYGIRFGEKRQLYNRYFEFNLEKVGQKNQPGQATTVQQPTQPAGQQTAAQ